MPNFSYTASKSWTPYTFEEILKPLAMYTEEYNKQEDALADISTKAEMLRRQAQEAGGKVADAYNSYANELDEQATLLTKYGLSPSTRASIKNLQKQYASNIVPIEDAIKYKKAIADEQRKLKVQKPGIMFNRDYSTINLNDIYNNPELSYEVQDGEDITKRVAEELKNYKNTLLRSGEWKSTASGQLLERRKSTGLTRDDLVMIMQNPKSFPEIHQLIENVIDTTGIRNWNNQQLLNKAYAYAYEALPAGLGREDIDIQKNEPNRNEYEQWQLEKLKRELGVGTPPPEPTDLPFEWIGDEVTANEDINVKELNELSKSFSEYENAVNSGKIPKPKSTPVYSVKDPLTGKQKIAYYKEVIDDPRLIAYNTLVEKYGTSNIDELKALIKKDIKKSATLTRGAKLNRLNSKILMDKLYPQLFGSISDLEDEDEVEKRIKKTSDGSAPTQEEISKLFSDDSTGLAYYPSSNTVRLISPKYGNYDVNIDSAFGNILVYSPLDKRDVPLSYYLKSISEEWLNSNDSEENTKGFNNLLSLGMGTLNEYYNTGIPEAPRTSSKAGIWSGN